MHKILHILTQNDLPPRLAASTEDILLTGDAVYLCLNKLAKDMPKQKIFILNNDILARGIAQVSSEFTPISIQQIVELIPNYKSIITW